MDNVYISEIITFLWERYQLYSERLWWVPNSNDSFFN